MNQVVYSGIAAQIASAIGSIKVESRGLLTYIDHTTKEN